MITASQKRSPGWRTHGRRMKPVVGDPFFDDSVHRRGLHLAAERRRKAGTRIVDQNDQYVRRICREPARRHPLLVDRFLHRTPSNAGRGRRRERKGLLLFEFFLRVSHPSLPVVCDRRPRLSINAPPELALNLPRRSRWSSPSQEWRKFGHYSGADEHDRQRPLYVDFVEEPCPQASARSVSCSCQRGKAAPLCLMWRRSAPGRG